MSFLGMLAGSSGNVGSIPPPALAPAPAGDVCEETPEADAEAGEVAEDDGATHLVCSTCKLSKPKAEFMKNGRIMKTCSTHRVSKAANSTWDELVRAIRIAKTKGKPLEIKRFIMPFEQFQPLAAVTGKKDTKNRSRACKRLLQEMHRITGFKWCFRNTWRLQDSWVAKCSCAQDKSWDEINVFKPKAVSSMEDKNKVECDSSLTIRIYFASRNFEIELLHNSWHECVFPPPPVGGKKGKGKQTGHEEDEEEDDFDEREVQAGVGDPSLMSGFRAGGQGSGGSGSAFKLTMPQFVPVTGGSPNSDSYNHCNHLLHRAAHIMNETRSYMLDGDNFAQFRTFFQGIEAFVNAYEQQQSSGVPAV